MKSHYFVEAFLPQIDLDQEAPLSLKEFWQLLEENLSDSELKIFSKLLLFYDIENLFAYWQDMPLKSCGSYQKQEVENIIQFKELFPGYVYDFLDKYPSLELRRQSYHELIEAYFFDSAARGSEFIQRYFAFEISLRKFLASLSAKHRQKETVNFSEFEENFFSAKDIDEIFLVEILEKYSSDPLQLYNKYNEYRFKTIQQFVEEEFFSFNRLLAYYLQLIIAHDRAEMKKSSKENLSFLDSILAENL